MAYTRAEIYQHWLEPDFKFFVNREGAIAERTKFLLQEERMRGEYLGACLDYVRWGAPDGVMYEMNSRGLIDFVQEWMKLNPDLKWHEFQPPADFSLPYVNNSRCPVNEFHKGTVNDRAGRLRCADIWSRKPCYAILSDKKIILPLETVLDKLNIDPNKSQLVYCASGIYGVDTSCKRLDELDEADREHYKHSSLCPGHRDERKRLIFPFDGWTLAHYVQRWHEQVPEGKAPVFENK